MKIAISADHAGFELKEHICACLRLAGVEVVDFGPGDTKSVDYPDYGEKTCRAVMTGECERGILICGTGIGMSIVANRFSGIRAALCSEPLSARLSRQHNDSNILVMGGRMIGQVMAEEIARVWLDTAFDGGRHIMRLDKIRKIEERTR